MNTTFGPGCVVSENKKKEQFFFNFEGFPDNNITINSLYLFLTINPGGGESTRYAKTVSREPGACRLLLF